MSNEAVLDVFRKGVRLKKRELETVVQLMDRAYYAPSAKGGQKFLFRRDQIAPALMLTHPDPKEIGLLKCAQDGGTETGSGGAILDVLAGYTTAYYLPNAGKAKRHSQETFDHWIDTVPEVLAELKADSADDKVKQNNVTEKAFLNATLYCYGAKTASNTDSISLQKAWVDEPNRITDSVGGEGGILGLLGGRFGSIASGQLRTLGTPTVKGGRISRFIDSCKHVFECYWPCPRCKMMQTADWGGDKVPHGFKWDRIYDDNGKLDIEESAATAHYICANEDCREKISQSVFRDQLENYCEWYSSTGFWFDISGGKGEFKKEIDGEYRVVSAPAKVGIRKTKDGSGLYGMTAWPEAVRRFLGAIDEFNRTKDTIEYLEPFFNLFRAIIWIPKKQNEVQASVVMDLRKDYGCDVPACIQSIGLMIDVQERFVKYLLVGYAPNGDQVDFYGLSCRRFDGKPSNHTAELWDRLSDIDNQTYRREDGVDLPVSICLIDARKSRDNVIKWCAEKSDRRFGLFGTADSGTSDTKPLFDFDEEKSWRTAYVDDREYGAYAVGINSHECSRRLYQRLSIAVGKPGSWVFNKNDEFSEGFADEVVADKRYDHYLPTGETVGRYKKDHSSIPNEGHDLCKYAEPGLYALQKHGGGLGNHVVATPPPTPLRTPTGTGYKAFGS